MQPKPANRYSSAMKGASLNKGYRFKNTAESTPVNSAENKPHLGKAGARKMPAARKGRA